MGWRLRLRFWSGWILGLDYGLMLGLDRFAVQPFLRGLGGVAAEGDDGVEASEGQ